MPLISTGLAKDWIQKLLGLWAEVRRERGAEPEAMEREIGDPERLAPFYVEPDCQPLSPAEHLGEEKVRASRQPIRDWLNRFLEGPSRERDGCNTVFLLAGAGMGKSSFLMMLKLTHLARFWPSDLRFVLHKLGPESLKEIAALDRPDDTVLLLDALDQDPSAWGRVEKRLAELLRAGKSFRQVVITCRPRFFPEMEKAGTIEVAGHVAELLYLSPFSEPQVEACLRKVYPDRWFDRVRKWFTRANNRNLERARRLMAQMASLEMRPMPMLLAHVQDLMAAGVERWTSRSVYRALVDARRSRQERELEAGDGIQELLVADALIEGRAAGGDGEERLRITDQILAFLYSWIEEDPAPRLAQVPWRRLDSGDWWPASPGLDLQSANLAGADLRGAVLAGADLAEADLRAADLRGSDLRGVSLRGAEILGAELDGALLHQARGVRMSFGEKT